MSTQRIIDCLGRRVLCPNCTVPARVNPSRIGAPKLVDGLDVTPCRPNWAVLDCPRCGKTQFPAATRVAPVPDPVTEPEPEPERKAVKHGR